MHPTKRIIVNTLVQYLKSVFTIGLSFYTTRLILDALKVDDFGIYSVVGGVVTMLGFIANAMVITTQRYISFYFGRGDAQYVKKLFTNSLLLHIIIGSVLAIILLLLTKVVMGMLTIPEERFDTAQKVYFITTALLFITIIIAPFKALFIAREHITYIALVEIVDAVVKLLCVIALTNASADKLLLYALIMAAIQLLNLMAYAGYSRWKFPECRLLIYRHDIDGKTMKSIFNFAGWSTFGMGSIAARNQGVAVILNHFFGTAINAAYGLAFQIYNSMAFVSSSILNAMNPQIMKAEGGGDHQKMLRLAGQESKFSVALMAIVSIPILIELPAILDVWIKNEVPPYTAMFCTYIIVSFMIDQATIGLHAVNQAMGHIRTYSLLTFTPKLLSVILVWLLLHLGFPVDSSMWVFITIETLVSIVRLPYLKHTAGLSIPYYLRHTILPLVPLFAASIVSSYGIVMLFHLEYRFILTIIVSMLVTSLIAWRYTLSNEERRFFTESVMKRLRG